MEKTQGRDREREKEFAGKGRNSRKVKTLRKSEQRE